MPATTPRPAAFVDRDDTLIEDPGYVCDPDEVRLQPGAADAVARLRAAGYPVIVVTNQSGIARGLLTEAQLAEIHQRMQDLLHAHGTGVDAIYYCPYLEGPEAVVEEYRQESDLRKPAPGMLRLAARDLNIDLAASWMIGDSERDMQAGRSAGCRTVLLVPKGLRSEISADFVAADLAAAVDVILQHLPADISSAPIVVAGAEAPSEPWSSTLQTTARPEGRGSSWEGEAPAEPRGTGIMPVSFAATGRMPEPQRESQAPAEPTPTVEPAAVVERANNVRDQSPASHTASAISAAPATEMNPAHATPPPGDGRSPQPASLSVTEELTRQVLEELRLIRRQRQHHDFSVAKLAAAVAQAVALCAVAWGLYSWISMSSSADPSTTAANATLSLLVGIALQVMALTLWLAADRR